LELEYDLSQPMSETAVAPRWSDGQLHWQFGFFDGFAGGFLEQWLPANLIYDRFPVKLELELVDSASEHTVVTNGELEPLGDSRWRLTFPDDFTAQMPMVFVEPSALLDQQVTSTELMDGSSVELRTYAYLDRNVDLQAVADRTAAAVQTFTTSLGPYGHGNAFTAMIIPLVEGGLAGMEYAGATTAPWVWGGEYAVDHEVFHSWYGRGVQPASQNDGWIDEGLATWLTEPTVIDPLPMTDPPSRLIGASPWNRRLLDDDFDAMELYERIYLQGARVFVSIAAAVGEDQLRGLISDFYLAHQLERVETADLETFLFCRTQVPEVRQVFHRFVYGEEGDTAPPPDGYCDGV
jgi:hypothetical protein